MTFAEQPFTEWVLSRPPEIQRLMIDWPPEARVRAKDGAVLMVPAPGLVGKIVSWFEAGNVGVLAPLAIGVRTPAGEELGAGEELRGECDPEKLEIVEFAVFGETTINNDLIRSIVERSQREENREGQEEDGQGRRA